MRRLTLRQPWRLELESVAPRPLNAGELRIAVGATGICASDVHGYAGRSSRREPGTVMGHEVAGTVVEVGPGVSIAASGDRVAVDPVVWCGACHLCQAGLTHLCSTRRLYGCSPLLPGGFAEELVVRAQNVVPLDPRLTFEVASLIEPLTVGVHAAARAELAADDDVLILGSGMIGLATALAAALTDRSLLVVVSEPDDARRRAAAELGLDCREPETLADGSYAVVFECVGGVGLLDAAVAHARPRGRVIAVGLADELVPVSMSPLVMEERTITGSAVYTHDEFVATAAWAAEEHERLARMVEDESISTAWPTRSTISRKANGRVRPVRTVMTHT